MILKWLVFVIMLTLVLAVLAGVAFAEQEKSDREEKPQAEDTSSRPAVGKEGE